MSRICEVDGCEKKLCARGLCSMHYWRLTTNGTLDRIRPTAQEAFWPKVDKTGGCWLWTGLLDRDGYGKHTFDGRPQMAHRLAYLWTVGQIPEGLQIDHLCRNRRCVNPAHMEAVDGKTNTIRGFGPSAANARKSHCKRGHEFTPENTWTRATGARQCKTCRRDASREHKRRAREASRG